MIQNRGVVRREQLRLCLAGLLEEPHDLANHGPKRLMPLIPLMSATHRAATQFGGPPLIDEPPSPFWNEWHNVLVATRLTVRGALCTHAFAGLPWQQV